MSQLAEVPRLLPNFRLQKLVDLTRNKSAYRRPHGPILA